MGQGYHHTPVMVREVLEGLLVRPGGRYIDATVGEGGHAEAMLKACQPGGRVLGIDADASSIHSGRGRLKGYGDSFLTAVGNFAQIGAICGRAGFHPVQGVLFDLGISSRQLADGARGFSFQREGPLDMRFDLSQELTADHIVNTWSETDLARGIWSYGEEPKSRRIARALVAGRPIKTTLDLAGLVSEVHRGARRKIHPATRTFQALRIMVNRELESLKAGLGQVIEILASGGRLAVITYHSLEAAIVKAFLRQEVRGCICPPEAPICSCGRSPTMRQVSRKAIAPGQEEIAANPRSRSARLRIGERI
ncbi:MAG: 16S rRNA (cytosine(1402)-N(4))-methyltransferase RsmH [Dehalococcoidia bacterium]